MLCLWDKNRDFLYFIFYYTFNIYFVPLYGNGIRKISKNMRRDKVCQNAKAGSLFPGKMEVFLCQTKKKKRI
jgi:hypothetical protein